MSARRVALAAALVAAAAALPARAEVPSLYADVRARQVGDLLTILIVETTTARSQASTSTERSEKVDFDMQGLGDLDFIPGLGMDFDKRKQVEGDGTTERRGSFEGRVTVQIVEVLENGTLVVEGTRALNVNGEKEMTVLRGSVRPQDIRPDNTVMSYHVADSEISYLGNGPVAAQQKPGILTRLFLFFF
jgi:flagellar L-ring protein precursor FlgH